MTVSPPAVPVPMIAIPAITPAPARMVIAMMPAPPLHLRDVAVVRGGACRQRGRRSGLRCRRGSESQCGDQAGKDGLSHLNLLRCERMFAVVSRLMHDGGSAARQKRVCLHRNRPEQIVRIERACERTAHSSAKITKLKSLLNPYQTTPWRCRGRFFCDRPRKYRLHRTRLRPARDPRMDNRPRTAADPRQASESRE